MTRAASTVLYVRMKLRTSVVVDVGELREVVGEKFITRRGPRLARSTVVEVGDKKQASTISHPASNMLFGTDRHVPQLDQSAAMIMSAE